MGNQLPCRICKNYDSCSMHLMQRAIKQQFGEANDAERHFNLQRAHWLRLNGLQLEDDFRKRFRFSNPHEYQEMTNLEFLEYEYERRATL
jgi:hypothetical protein